MFFKWVSTALITLGLVLLRPLADRPTGAVYIKYVTLFLANLYPLPLPHFVTHLGPPPPIFRRPSTKIPDKSPLVQILYQLFAGVFVRGSFVWKPGLFCQNTSVT